MIEFTIFDAEIKNAIPTDEPLIEGIKYCEGWRDFENMGISVLCAKTLPYNRTYVFMDDNKEQFAELIKQSKVTVGFNSKSFDNNLIKAEWGIDINLESHIDIYKEILLAKFGDENKRVKGYKLDNMMEANIGYGKTGTGDHAPILYQTGRVGENINYCINDINGTTEVFECILRDEYLYDPNDQQKIDFNNLCDRINSIVYPFYHNQ